MLFSQILLLAGRVALAASSTSSGAPVIAEYSRDMPAYASFKQSLRVIPLPDQTLVVIHMARVPAETSGISATVLRQDTTIAAEWRATDWVRQGAQQMPRDVRLQTNPGQVGQIYGVASLPGTGQLAVSIGWLDGAGRVENGVALVRVVNGAYMADKVLVLPMMIRDLAAGPGNTFFACVFNARAFGTTHQSPTLAALDTDGNVLAEVFLAQPTIEADAARNNQEARVIALSGTRLAFVSPETGKAYILRMESSSDAPVQAIERSPTSRRRTQQGAHEASLRASVESVMALTKPVPRIQSADQRISARAIYVDERQRVSVLYSLGTEYPPTLVLMENTAGGTREIPVPAAAALRAAYWIDGRLQTIMMDKDRAVVTTVSPEPPSH